MFYLVVPGGLTRGITRPNAKSFFRAVASSFVIMTGHRVWERAHREMGKNEYHLNDEVNATVEACTYLLSEYSD